MTHQVLSLGDAERATCTRVLQFDVIQNFILALGIFVGMKKAKLAVCLIFFGSSCMPGGLIGAR